MAAGGAHHTAERGAGQRARGEELLPAGERQDPQLLGDLQEKPEGEQGRAEEQTEGKGGGRGPPPSRDQCTLHHILHLYT